MSQIRVLAFGAWDQGPGYPRTHSLFQGLRLAGVSVTECRVDLPFAGVSKRRLLSSPWRWPGYWWSLRRRRRAATQALSIAISDVSPDAILVPYPGHFVVGWLRSVWDGPILLDMFLSLFDTAVIDRRLFQPRSPIARWMRHIDRRACRQADVVLTDTQANAGFLAELVELPPTRFAVVPVSDPHAPDRPPPSRTLEPGQPLELLFFGTGVPLHGLIHLLDAVDRCRDVRLTLIGGSSQERTRALEMPAERVRILDEFVSVAELSGHISKAHLVAGVFGTSPKTDRVIPLKVVHALSHGRPVITADTRSAHAMLGGCCVTVPTGDSEELSRALDNLAVHPELLRHIASRSRSVYDSTFSVERVGSAMLIALSKLNLRQTSPSAVEELEVSCR